MLMAGQTDEQFKAWTFAPRNVIADYTRTTSYLQQPVFNKFDRRMATSTPQLDELCEVVSIVAC